MTQMERKTGENAVQISFGGFTHVGKVREQNEDSFLMLVRSANVPADQRLPEGVPFDAVFAVTDGMGGLSHGKAASQSVVDGLRQRLTVAEIRRIGERLSVNPSDPAMLLRRIIEDLKADVDRSGGGATLTLLALKEGRWYLAFLGDSRAFRFASGESRPVMISEDHKVGEHGGLLNGLGAQFLSFKVWLADGDMRPGDFFVLQTDGANRLNPAYFHRFREEGDMAEAAQACVEKAVELDGSDNATIVIVKCSPPAELSGNTIILPLPKAPVRRTPVLSARWLFMLIGTSLFVLLLLVGGTLWMLLRDPVDRPSRPGDGMPTWLHVANDAPVWRFQANGAERAMLGEERLQRQGDVFETPALEWGRSNLVIQLRIAGQNIPRSLPAVPTLEQVGRLDTDQFTQAAVEFLERQKEWSHVADLAHQIPPQPASPIIEFEDEHETLVYTDISGVVLTNGMVREDWHWGQSVVYVISNRVSRDVSQRTLMLPPDLDFDSVSGFVASNPDWENFISDDHRNLLARGRATLPADLISVRTNPGQRPVLVIGDFDAELWQGPAWLEPLSEFENERLRWWLRDRPVSISNVVSGRVERRNVDLLLDDPAAWLDDDPERALRAVQNYWETGPERQEWEPFLSRCVDVYRYLTQTSQINDDKLKSIFLAIESLPEPPPADLLRAFTNRMNEAFWTLTMPDRIRQSSALRDVDRINEKMRIYTEQLRNCSYTPPPDLMAGWSWQPGTGSRRAFVDGLARWFGGRPEAGIAVVNREAHEDAWAEALEQERFAQLNKLVTEAGNRQLTSAHPCVEEHESQRIRRQLIPLSNLNRNTSVAEMTNAISRAWALGQDMPTLRQTLASIIAETIADRLQEAIEFQALQELFEGLPDDWYGELSDADRNTVVDALVDHTDTLLEFDPERSTWPDHFALWGDALLQKSIGTYRRAVAEYQESRNLYRLRQSIQDLQPQRSLVVGPKKPTEFSVALRVHGALSNEILRQAARERREAFRRALVVIENSEPERENFQQALEFGR
jgi:PPM family protein phosphatase